MPFLSWLESSPPRDRSSQIAVKLVPWGTGQSSVGSKHVPQGTGPDKVALRHVPWGTKSHFENVVTLTPPLKVTFSPKYIPTSYHLKLSLHLSFTTLISIPLSYSLPNNSPSIFTHLLH